MIGGLINGIESMVGSVGGAISHIAGEITSHLSFSPAKKGPLSGGGSPLLSGRPIARMLARGMAQGLPYIQSAARLMASAARTVMPAAGAASVTAASAVAAARGVQPGVLSGAAAVQPVTINHTTHVTAQLNGRTLFEGLQAETLRYNIRNTGTVTGAMKPGTP